MSYEQFDKEEIEADPTIWGRLGLREGMVADIKSALKRGTGLAVSATEAATSLAKVAVPVVGQVASMVVTGGMIARDTVAATKTRYHLDGLRKIQSDIVSGNACRCGHCGEAVGYAISQKDKKLGRKQADMVVGAVGALLPIPTVKPGMVIGAVHAVQKKVNGTKGEQRNRQALLLHKAARGVRFLHKGTPTQFVGGCPAARAIIQELTGHWQRVVMADDGADIIALKLRSA